MIEVEIVLKGSKPLVRGVVRYNELTCSLKDIDFPDPHIKNDIEVYLNTEQTFRVPQSSSIDDYIEETAKPVDDLFYFETAMSSLYSDLGIWVDWSKRPKFSTDGGIDYSLQQSFHVIDLEKANHKLHGRVNFQGIDVSVENRKGSIRSGIDKDGHPWHTKMKHAYGRIIGINRKGGDTEHVDVFLGPDRNSQNVFIVHLMRADDASRWDEDKTYLGFKSRKEVKASFDAHYDKVGKKLYGGMSEMSLDAFKQRLNVQSKGMIKSLS